MQVVAGYGVWPRVRLVRGEREAAGGRDEDMRRGRLRVTETCCVHITQRCHDRRYLLRFARDRRRYVERLREMSQRFSVEVLDYIVTSNHVHLLLWAGPGGSSTPCGTVPPEVRSATCLLSSVSGIGRTC